MIATRRPSMASGAPNARSVQAATAAPPSAIPTSTPTAKPPELSGTGADHGSPGPAAPVASPGFGPIPSGAPQAVWNTIVAIPFASSAGNANVFVASAAAHAATTWGLGNPPAIDGRGEGRTEGRCSGSLAAACSKVSSAAPWALATSRGGPA